MLPVLLLTIGGLITGYSLWQLKRWLREAGTGLNEGPRRLEALAEELINSAEAASAVVAEETERLADLIARAEGRAVELRGLLERSPDPVHAPAGAGRTPGLTSGRVTVTAVPLRFRHARKEIRRTAPERAALSQPGPAMIQLVPAMAGPQSGSIPLVPGAGPAAPHSAPAAEAADPDSRGPAGTAALPASAVRPAGSHSETPETHRLVYTLADKGNDVTQIARQLSMAKGEVQLILGLRRLN